MIENQDSIKITVNEAGRKGGLKVLRERGRSYFVDIGRKGQLVTRSRYANMASRWGRLGGRPRKPKLSSSIGEINK